MFGYRGCVPLTPISHAEKAISLDPVNRGDFNSIAYRIGEIEHPHWHLLEDIYKLMRLEIPSECILIVNNSPKSPQQLQYVGGLEFDPISGGQRIFRRKLPWNTSQTPISLECHIPLDRVPGGIMRRPQCPYLPAASTLEEEIGSGMGRPHALLIVDAIDNQHYAGRVFLDKSFREAGHNEEFLKSFIKRAHLVVNQKKYQEKYLGIVHSTSDTLPINPTKS